MLKKDQLERHQPPKIYSQNDYDIIAFFLFNVFQCMISDEKIIKLSEISAYQSELYVYV